MTDISISAREAWLLYEHARGHVDKLRRKLATKTVDNYATVEEAARASINLNQGLEEWLAIREKMEVAHRQSGTL